MVDRYGQDWEGELSAVIKRETGPYVLYSDYEALEAKNNELKQEIKDRAYSEKCVTKTLHDVLDERDELQAKLAALVE